MEEGRERETERDRLFSFLAIQTCLVPREGAAGRRRQRVHCAGRCGFRDSARDFKARIAPRRFDFTQLGGRGRLNSRTKISFTFRGHAIPPRSINGERIPGGGERSPRCWSKCCAACSLYFLIITREREVTRPVLEIRL